jgi:hypothetical protein
MFVAFSDQGRTARSRKRSSTRAVLTCDVYSHSYNFRISIRFFALDSKSVLSLN